MSHNVWLKNYLIEENYTNILLSAKMPQWTVLPFLEKAAGGIQRHNEVVLNLAGSPHVEKLPKSPKLGLINMIGLNNTSL